MNPSKPIYVETKISATIDELWEVTQQPQMHQLWDLRFSSIDYIPKENEDDPQQFNYRTKIGFGLHISGKGESVKTILNDGKRISSLKFWSDHPFSLIRTGSGYWEYTDEGDGVRFLTRYQYKTRFGRFGKLLDSFVFNLLMGWATAWSFDCMRLWLERGIHPDDSIRRNITHWICVFILAFIWIYQGIVPKILFPDSGELEILRGSGLFNGIEELLLTAVGVGEIGFGLLIFRFASKSVIYKLNIAFLILLAVGAAVSEPKLFIEPFNALTLNIAMIALSVIGWLSSGNLPKAAHCKRKAADEISAERVDREKENRL